MKEKPIDTTGLEDIGAALTYANRWRIDLQIDQSVSNITTDGAKVWVTGNSVSTASRIRRYTTAGTYESAGDLASITLPTRTQLLREGVSVGGSIRNTFGPFYDYATDKFIMVTVRTSRQGGTGPQSATTVNGWISVFRYNKNLVYEGHIITWNPEIILGRGQTITEGADDTYIEAAYLGGTLYLFRNSRRAYAFNIGNVNTTRRETRNYEIDRFNQLQTWRSVRRRINFSGGPTTMQCAFATPQRIFIVERVSNLPVLHAFEARPQTSLSTSLTGTTFNNISADNTTITNFTGGTVFAGTYSRPSNSVFLALSHGIAFDTTVSGLNVLELGGVTQPTLPTITWSNIQLFGRQDGRFSLFQGQRRIAGTLNFNGTWTNRPISFGDNQLAVIDENGNDICASVRDNTLNVGQQSATRMVYGETFTTGRLKLRLKQYSLRSSGILNDMPTMDLDSTYVPSLDQGGDDVAAITIDNGSFCTTSRKITWQAYITGASASEVSRLDADDVTVNRSDTTVMVTETVTRHSLTSSSYRIETSEIPLNKTGNMSITIRAQALGADSNPYAVTSGCVSYDTRPVTPVVTSGPYLVVSRLPTTEQTGTDFTFTVTGKLNGMDINIGGLTADDFVITSPEGSITPTIAR